MAVDELRPRRRRRRRLREDPEPEVDLSDSWEEWDRETCDTEREIAALLDDVEAGDEFAIGGDGVLAHEFSVEISDVDRRPGVTEIRCGHNTVVYVVRGKYVFITDRDFDSLVFPTWVRAGRAAKEMDMTIVDVAD